MTARQAPYAIIGGLAVQHWGEPRLTIDVDIAVSVPAEQTRSFVRAVLAQFTPRVKNPEEFACDTRVLPVRAANGCPVDLSLAIPGYEDQVMARAVEVEVEPGRRLRLCSAEDLIIHKALAGRPLDVQDIEGIVVRQRGVLDLAHVRRCLREFSAVLESPDVLECFEAAWRRLQGKDVPETACTQLRDPPEG